MLSYYARCYLISSPRLPPPALPQLYPFTLTVPFFAHYSLHPPHPSPGPTPPHSHYFPVPTLSYFDVMHGQDERNYAVDEPAAVPTE